MYKTVPPSPDHTMSTLKEQHSFLFRFENLVIYGPNKLLFLKKKKKKEGMEAEERNLKQFLRVCHINHRTVDLLVL